MKPCKYECDLKQPNKCFSCFFLPIYYLMAVFISSPIPPNCSSLGKLDGLIRKLQSLYSVFGLLYLWAFFLSNVFIVICFIPGLSDHLNEKLRAKLATVKGFTENVIGEVADEKDVKDNFFLLLLCCSSIFRYSVTVTIFFFRHKNEKIWKTVNSIWMKTMQLFSWLEREKFDKSASKLYWKLLLVFLVANVSFLIYSNQIIGFSNSSHIANMSILFQVVASAVFIIMIAAIGGAWISPMIYLFSVSHIVSRVFDKINEEIGEMMDGKISMEGLYAVHDKHQSLTELVLALDTVFNEYIFIVYFTTIPECCLALYFYLFSGISPQMKELIFMWMLVALFIFLVLSLSAAKIPDSAHETYDCLCHLFANDTTSEQQSKILLMLERLSGPKIGLTCLDLLVVTKSTIVNVIGMTATYFLTVIQFRGIGRSVAGNA